MPANSKSRLFFIFSGIGIFICLTAAYFLFQEIRILKVRDGYYENIIRDHRKERPAKVIEAAKNYFAKQPLRHNQFRERQVLELYEDALKHWVALHSTDPDTKLKEEIEIFSNFAAEIMEAPL